MASAKQPVVLLAEDDDDLRELIARRLVREGMRVVEIEDGFELRDYLSLCRPGGDLPEPDAVISDVYMPGETGPHALEGSECFHAPVVLISSCATAELQDCAKRIHAAASFEKPLSLDALVRVLRQAMVCPSEESDGVTVW